MISIYGRIAGVVALLVLLAGIGWKLDHNGYKRSQAEWNAEKLATSENARLREQAAQKTVERVDREYQVQKNRLVADKRVTDDRLRDFKATISANTDTSAPSGTDDPRDAVIDRCASALVGMEQYAKGVALTATGLQGYTREVCLVK